MLATKNRWARFFAHSDACFDAFTSVRCSVTILGGVRRPQVRAYR
jgi:hypothetical protein